MPLRIPKNRSPSAAQRAVEAHPERRGQGLAREPGRDRVGELGALDAPSAAGRGRPGWARRAASPGARPSWSTGSTRASSRGRRGCGASAITAMPAKNGSPAASPRARSSSAGPVCQSWTWRTSSGVPSRRSAARAARQKTANRHGSSGVVVERRRGRTPPARPPGAAGSRRPRRRRSATGQRRPPRAGPAIARAGSAHGAARAPAPTGSGAGTRRPGPASPAPASGSAAERPRERVHHVGQAAGLGPGLAFGGEERDSHRHVRDRTPGEGRAARRTGRAGAVRQRPRHGLNRFTRPGGCRLSSPAHGTPRPRSRRARRAVPPAAQARGPPAARLQPVVELAPAGPDRCSPGSTPAPGPATATRSPSCRGPVDWGQLLDNPRFMAEYEDILARVRRLHGQRRGPLVRSATTATQLDGPIAYFCAEYGFHESLGIYSGGLGVLAGDHMKTASDMALPLVGVGLMYRKGYFRQTIDADGHQEHAYPDYELSRPADPARPGPARASRSRSACELPGRDLFAAVWVAQVGRVPVLLLDTDLPGQRRLGPADHAHPLRPRPRDAPAPGAGPGRRRRARPAGARPRARGLAPQRGPLGVPARRAGARARRRRARRSTTPGRSVRAQQRVHDPHARSRRATSASTRTSSAGSPARCSRATGARTPAASRSTSVLELGRGVDGDPSQFDMTAFSLRLTNGANAVSPAPRPHGQRHLARRRRRTRSWASPTASTPRPGSASRCATSSSATPNADLDAMDDEPAERRFWERIGRGPHGRAVGGAPAPEAGAGDLRPRPPAQPVRPPRRGARRRSRSSRRSSTPAILTIGFARRFATYKRAALLFTRHRPPGPARSGTRTGRCRSSSPARPTRRTGPARASSRTSSAAPAAPKLRGRVFILEDYDIRIARFLVAGRGRLAQQPAPPARGVGHVAA